jgi:LysM repeat protein
MNDTTSHSSFESATENDSSGARGSASKIALIAVVLAAIAIAMGAVAMIQALRAATEAAESRASSTNLATQVSSVVSKQAATGLQLSSIADKAEGAVLAASKQNQAIRLLSQEDSSLRIEDQRLATQDANAAAKVETLTQQVQALRADLIAATNKLVRVPPPAPKAETTRSKSSEPSGGESGKTYVVKSGDTFEKIANKHGTTIDALMQANPGVDPRRLQIDQRLRLP